MFEQWHPSTREERAKYKEIQKNWNQIYNNEKKQKPNLKSSLLVICIFSCVFIKMLWPIEMPMFNNSDVRNNSVLTDENLGGVGRKIVSNYDAKYLRKASDISKANDTLTQEIVKDLNSKGYVNYSVYTEDIEKIIEEIEILESMHIGVRSDIKPYEETCKNFYGEYKQFYITFQFNEVITVKEYNKLIENLNNIKTPYNHLKELFELNNYEHVVTENHISYKYKAN